MCSGCSGLFRGPLRPPSLCVSTSTPGSDTDRRLLVFSSTRSVLPSCPPRAGVRVRTFVRGRPRGSDRPTLVLSSRASAQAGWQGSPGGPGRRGATSERTDEWMDERGRPSRLPLAVARVSMAAAEKV